LDALAALAGELLNANVRFVVMGVWGANYYARASGTVFTTVDRDLFLPCDPANLVRAWQACEVAKHTLWCGREPLDVPHDLTIAERIVEHRALTTAIAKDGLQTDLSLVMGHFTFEDVWSRRRSFLVDGVSIPVARLMDIVQSESTTGRPKDLLFLATHQDALEKMQPEDDDV
jgi:hypothetical protein